MNAHNDSAGQADDTEIGQKRKRQARQYRASVACDSCRVRKAKCDESAPCSSCVPAQGHGFNCTYRISSAPRKSKATSDIRTSEQKLLSLPLLSEGTSNGHSKSYSRAPLQTDSRPKRAAVFQQQSPVRNSPIHRSGTQDACTGAAQSIGISHNIIAESPNDSVKEINHRTQGTEYYGPSGLISILSQLRSKAGPQNQPPTSRTCDDDRSDEIPQPTSIVNLWHDPEYEMGPSNEARLEASDEQISAPTPLTSDSLQNGAFPRTTLAQQCRWRAIGAAPGMMQEPNHSPPRATWESERELMKLYFCNLHLIHPVVDEVDFFSRCKEESWFNVERTTTSLTKSKRVFFALACMVVALGAITAGEGIVPETAAKDYEHPRRILPALSLAKLYFEKARANIGDIFTTCSLESTQTLFLMSIFCQNALQPHSCYMYSGVAVRTALATGLPSDKEVRSSLQSRLWWSIYSHEIEMCSSAGRESSLGWPSRHAIPAPPSKSTGNSPYDIIQFMIPLAGLLHLVSEEVYHPQKMALPVGTSVNALKLDERLEDWKAQLPPSWDMDAITLTEPEWMTKQKIVLRLRFLNAKILIHRPFLSSAATVEGRSVMTSHVQSCVDASRQTIALLYEAYMHRPYFRTWWYNTTYLLYASMTLLYVVIANIHAQSCDVLLLDVDRSIKILQVMDKITIAKRCEQFTSEVLDAAKKVYQSRSQLSADASADSEATSSTGLTASFDIGGWSEVGFGVPSGSEFHFPEDDLFAGLLDIHLPDGLMEFEDLFAEM